MQRRNSQTTRKHSTRQISWGRRTSVSRPAQALVSSFAILTAGLSYLEGKKLATEKKKIIMDKNIEDGGASLTRMEICSGGGIKFIAQAE